MEAVGGTASVIAIVNLSAKLFVLCSEYITAVSKAPAEISSFRERVKSLETVAQHASRLLKSPDGRLLSTSSELENALQRCENELNQVHGRLAPSTKRKAMRRIGFRALKWPFKRGEVEAIIASLTTYQYTITNALQIDQTYVHHTGSCGNDTYHSPEHSCLKLTRTLRIYQYRIPSI